MIYFICIIHLHIFHGNIWTHNWPAPNVSGFIAQLVERRTSIGRSWVQAPLKSWGKGFWKLNTSLLSEKRYVKEIKTAIESTVNQYKDYTLVNPALLWEMIKLKVREKTISYAVYKKVTRRKCKEMLEREISLLEKHLDSSSYCNPSYHIVAERIFILKKELENIFEYRTKGAIIRS